MTVKPAHELYTCSFSGGNETRLVSEVQIELPDMPPEEEMRNYDKAIKDQKFTREVIPDDIYTWPEWKIEEYAKAQWHRRLNGEWWLIKGEPFYIPGGALTFFDYWTTEGGKKPAFRMEALDFFLFWYMFVERDPNIFGMYDLKCRRLGDTEKIMFLVWERTTRFKNVKAGLQSYTDDEAAANFSRLTTGNANMPFFFKPLHSGSDKMCLAYMRPSEVMTLKKIREMSKRIDTKNEHEQFLNSYIDYESTQTGKYDGRQLFTYHLDEVFKIKPHLLNPKEQWKNIKKVQSLNNDMLIYGKSVFSSTVEEKTTGDVDETTIDIAEWFWDNSDPNDRNEFGRTYSGLARVFRGYEYNAPIDEYGFHQVEKARNFRDAKIKQYREKGDFAGLLDLYHKEPASPEEALSQASEKCVLFPEMCHARLNQIKNGLNRWDEKVAGYRPKVVEGELVWENGIRNTRVVFIPTKGGKWHISQHPLRPNAVSRRPGVYRKSDGTPVDMAMFRPDNMGYYRMGCDPYDADEVVGKGSDGAFTVKRRMYLPGETKQLEFDEAGFIKNVEDMETNTYIVDYKYRHKNPYKFYDDVIKTCWYYGVAVFVELDKPGFAIWAKQNGYGGFLQYEPPSLLSATLRRNARQGAKATTDVVNTYVEKLVSYVSRYIWNQHHPRIIQNWARFIPAKRTKFDMSVATGFTELADDDNRYTTDNKKQRNNWSHSPYNAVG